MAKSTDETIITIDNVGKFDLSIPLDALRFILVKTKDRPDLWDEDVKETYDEFKAVGRSDKKIANLIKERVKANARRIVKDETKIDHGAAVLALVGKYLKDDRTIQWMVDLIMTIIAVMNKLIDTYNAANPDANVLHFKLDGGKPKSRVGGKGNGRSYNKLGDMIKANIALWDGKPIAITYGAREVSFPIAWVDDRAVITYTGPSYTTYIDVKDDEIKVGKDGKADQSANANLILTNDKPIGRLKNISNGGLESGKQYPLGMINQIATWINGNNTNEDGTPNPVAGPNAWLTMRLKGIKIKDGMSTNTIENPSMAQFYDQYNASDEDTTESDDDA